MKLLGDIIRKNARRHENKIGLIYEDRELSFGEIARNVYRFANAMRDMGIAKGDHVAIVSKNCPEYLEFYFASATIGAIPVGINIVWWIRKSNSSQTMRKQNCSL